MSAQEIRRSRAFSLIELVIVVVIIGIIAAIAVPRMSRGAAGAADASLTANLAVLRNAIDLFYTEHSNTYPTAAKIQDQLLQFSDDTTGTSATKTATHVYGPYLRSIPPLPVGANKGKIVIGAFGGATVGWAYDETTGKIYSNTSVGEVDSRGVKYSDY